MDSDFPPPFSAVLLAGGKSSRMGRDKAGLIMAGRPLWQRQLEILRATGPAEVFISGRPGGPYAKAGVAIIEDAQPDLGPLGGLAGAWHHAAHDSLLVLAIDLPAMTSAFLSRLMRETPPGLGRVPFRNGRFEPLAAIYPRACLPLIEEILRTPDRALQRFVQRAVAEGLLQPHPIQGDDDALFRNVNRPEDLAGLG